MKLKELMLNNKKVCISVISGIVVIIVLIAAIVIKISSVNNSGQNDKAVVLNNQSSETISDNKTKEMMSDKNMTTKDSNLADSAEQLKVIQKNLMKMLWRKQKQKRITLLRIIICQVTIAVTIYNRNIMNLKQKLLQHQLQNLSQNLIQFQLPNPNPNQNQILSQKLLKIMLFINLTVL